MRIQMHQVRELEPVLLLIPTQVGLIIPKPPCKSENEDLNASGTVVFTSTGPLLVQETEKVSQPVKRNDESVTIRKALSELLNKLSGSALPSLTVVSTERNSHGESGHSSDEQDGEKTQQVDVALSMSDRSSDEQDGQKTQQVETKSSAHETSEFKKSKSFQDLEENT